MAQVKSLEEYFKKIPDLRRKQGTRYNLAKLLTVIVISIMNNALGYREMARFMKNNLTELQQYFGWQRNKTPSHEQIRTILNDIDNEKVNQAFLQWVHDNIKLEESDWIAFDGKAIRSTLTDSNNESQNFINVVTAFSHRLQTSLDQESFQNKKDHEGSAIRTILDRLKTAGLVITMDALHCQKNSKKD